MYECLKRNYVENLKQRRKLLWVTQTENENSWSDKKKGKK